MAVAVMFALKKWIRLCIAYNLIFFALLLLASCDNTKQDRIKVVWKDNRAVGISISKNLIANDDHSPEKRIAVRLENGESPIAMLGKYKVQSNEIIFEPLIPFTTGLSYEVLIDNKVVKELAVVASDLREAPVLLAVYPSQDTLPENLLKLYLQFSKPMREGGSLRYIKLLRNDHDTLPDVFLNLQPELWNEKRTMLTIWLDPGRIKRGLQPNLKLGAPLKNGDRYTLVISNQWKDIDGVQLATSHHKKFIATERDSISPDPHLWTIHTPTSNTRDALAIDLNSSLDYSLLNSTLHIVDKNGKAVLGKWKIENEEKSVSFTPDEEWPNESFQLQVESRLEDLAGNNINRPFDVDIRSNSKQLSKERIILIPFKVGSLNN